MPKFERVLLIDDNESDNVFHEIMLRRAGFEQEVIVFEAASAALVHLEANPSAAPTLIFLDINMPVMNGFEFARSAWPLLEKMPHVTIVMLTSSSATRDRTQAADVAEIHGYIVKPLMSDVAKRILDGEIKRLDDDG